MKIIVNGQPRELGEPPTVANLLHSLDLQSEQVAVEVNLQILNRTDFPTWNLHDGDKVEVISFIGGGSPKAKMLTR